MAPINLVICIISALVSLILITGCFPFRLQRAKNRYFLPMALLVCMMNIFGILLELLPWQVYPWMKAICAVLLCLTNFCRYAVLGSFTFYTSTLCGSRGKRSVRILTDISVPVCCLSFLFYCLSALRAFAGGTEKDIFRYSRASFFWYSLSGGGGFIIFILCLLIIFISSSGFDRKQLTALILFMAFPILASFIEKLHMSLNLMPTALALSLMTIQNHIQYDQTIRLTEQETQLANSRIKLMISQIRPHFIFNTLNTIYYLIEKDPAQAQHAVDEFSEYLRANLNNLENGNEVPFYREMEHVKHYLSLEKMRFGEELKIEYDLRAMDFCLPPMTVQPLVENAVKHGLMKKEDGGTVSVSSRETDDHFEVVICDDGTGFDVEDLREEKEDHVGIRNVRERLEKISSGRLDLESEPGKGTRAVILLKKEKTRKEGKRE